MKLLERRKVVDLRKRSGQQQQVGNKMELVLLAKKYAAIARNYISGQSGNNGDDSAYYPFLSSIATVAPSNTTQKNLLADPEGTLKSLQWNCKESSDTARLKSLSRDAHVSWVWNSLGKTNVEIIQKLNSWMDKSQSYETWFQRRRRGNLLLRFPVFAYQTVIPLDVRPGSLSPVRVLELMDSVPPIIVV
jgi:hypothetical protein